jgi:hypothetical protein
MTASLITYRPPYFNKVILALECVTLRGIKIYAYAYYYLSFKSKTNILLNIIKFLHTILILLLLKIGMMLMEVQADDKNDSACL